MTTIEERAIEKYPITAENADKAIVMRKLYVQIATEQRTIDIEKACEWFDRHAKSYVMDLTQEESLPAGCDKLVGFCLVDFVRDFRIEMKK